MPAAMTNQPTERHDDDDDDFIVQFKRTRRKNMLRSLVVVVVVVAAGTGLLVLLRPHPCERLARALCNPNGSVCPPNLVEAFVQKGTEEKCTAALGSLNIGGGQPGFQAMMGVQILREMLGPEAVDAQINAVRAKHGLPPLRPMPDIDKTTK